MGFRMVIDNKVLMNRLRDEFIKQGGRWGESKNILTRYFVSDVCFSLSDRMSTVVSKFINNIEKEHTGYQHIFVVKLAYTRCFRATTPMTKILIYYLVTY